MSNPERSLEALQRVIARIPAQARGKVLLDLAKDRELNPTGVTAQEINRRLLEIDKGALSEALGETRLRLLVELSDTSGVAEARGLWNEQPNQRSELGRAAMELRSGAKQIFAALARLNETPE